MGFHGSGDVDGTVKFERHILALNLSYCMSSYYLITNKVQLLDHWHGVYTTTGNYRYFRETGRKSSEGKEDASCGRDHVHAGNVYTSIIVSYLAVK